IGNITLATRFFRGSSLLPILIPRGWACRLSIFTNKPNPTYRPQQPMTEDIDSSQPNQTAGNLTDFLLAQKSGYLRAVEEGEAQKNSWTISMGNEAGDLDSLASAIGYAWYATRHLGQPTVPLLQTPRGDSVTGDELPAHAPPTTRYALLDHNVLAGRFAADDKARVVAIVDHHVDEQHHLDASPRIVEKDWPEGMSRGIARLLLCAVLIDTHGLKPGGKAVAVDREVAPFLLEKAELLSASAGEVTDVHDVKELMELTQTLVTKKDSVDGLSPRDLLRRDYKEYRIVATSKAEEGGLLVGLASVPRSVEMLTGGKKRAEGRWGKPALAGSRRGKWQGRILRLECTNRGTAKLRERRLFKVIL
ncbi:hypothetical protein BGW80DRAFT_1303383, partial [Lactifluus volemus]